MTTRPRLLTGTVAAAAVLTLAACSGSSANTGTANFPVGDQSITMLAPDKRPTPGALRGASVDGGTVDTADYRGHVVVLNVWGSWCAPCQAEAPQLEAASQALSGQGVKFLGLAVRQRDQGGLPAAKAFQRTYGVTYPSLYDEDSETLLALRGVVAPNAIPSTVVLDDQGRVAARFSGQITKTTLVDLVSDVIAGRTRAS